MSNRNARRARVAARDTERAEKHRPRSLGVCRRPIGHDFRMTCDGTIWRSYAGAITCDRCGASGAP